jgi:hypothetical protein
MQLWRPIFYGLFRPYRSFMIVVFAFIAIVSWPRQQNSGRQCNV